MREARRTRTVGGAQGEAPLMRAQALPDRTGHHAFRSALLRTAGWRTGLVAALSIVALALSALAATSASAETVWLCKPGLANNPCATSEETTVELGNGSTSVESPKPPSNPPIDCFYVYPTVSSQTNKENGHDANANLEIDPEETQVAIDQASRFSQTCKVYAPMYPQLTLAQINTAGEITPEASEKAYVGLLSAWQEYLAKYNDGRGVVLIGHSQGALILEQLIKEQFDANSALRTQLVSAIILGGNVLVPKGKGVGGSFKTVPACQAATQTHCVVAYSSFLKEPPENADFGRVSSPLLGGTLTEEESKNDEVLCVNPAELAGSSAGPLFRYESTTPFPGLLGSFWQDPKGSTPWVSMPEQYSGQCERANGATWLNLHDIGPEGDPRELIKESLGPAWGTHLEDVNVALGNLVGLTGTQSKSFLETVQVASINPTSGSTSGETAVTIKGFGFVPGATVKIGNQATSVDVVSESEITAKTAATAAGPDEVVVTDTNGTSTGGPTYTYVSAPLATATTGAASAVTTTSATLNATVNPDAATVTECKFEWGLTVSYGSSVPCASLPGSGENPVAVSAPLAGLTANTTYHFRISATTAGGTTKGSDQTFKTLLAGHVYQNGVKIAEGEPFPVIEWGTLKLNNLTLGEVECRTAVGGYVENPAGGGPAIGKIETLAMYNCICEGCASLGGKIKVTTSGLPWSVGVTEESGSTFREITTGVEVTLDCEGVETNFFHGEWKPKTINGTAIGSKPAIAEFESGAGELESSVGGLKPGGKLNVEGYGREQVVAVKSP